MCRNIKTLHNFEPPATDDEIRASALQFVRKLSGFTRPSKANEPAFNRAVDEVSRAAHELLASLVTNARRATAKPRRWEMGGIVIAWSPECAPYTPHYSILMGHISSASWTSRP